MTLHSPSARALATAVALAFVVALAALPAAGGEPASRDAALGPAGEVYIAHRGPCAELVSGCGAGGEQDPVLVLDELRPGATAEAGIELVRRLVPGTDTAVAEGVPTLVFEETTERPFLVWESQDAPDRSRIFLAWLEDGEWSPVIEVSGDSEPLKGPPRVAVTRDRFELDEGEGEGEGEAAVIHERTVIHLAWWEQGPERDQIFYTPIVLVDGDYPGGNQVYNLTELDATEPPAEPQGLAPALARSPRIEPGRDESSVVIAFANPASERFVTFESRVLPVELTDLAGRVHAFLLADAGANGLPATGEAVQSLADRLRGHMIDIGRRVHPALVAHLADELTAALGAGIEEGESAVALADRLRGHMIDIGARVLATGGLIGDSQAQLALVLEAGTQAGKGSAMPRYLHTVRLTRILDLPAPAVEAAATECWIHLSADGERAVVGWSEDGALAYRESSAGAWTEVRRLTLGAALDESRAEELLARRVRDR